MTVGTGIVTGASVSHDGATLDDIEQAAAESERTAVEHLLSVPAVEEALALQTCNRTEAYVVTAEAADGVAALDAFFDGVAPSVRDELGHEASLRHLMRVACGLESLVLGEDQILGQLKDAYETAQAAGSIGPVLEEGVTKAIHVGERARTETEINEGAVSIASAAVTLASEELSLDEATGLVVGAGEMGRLAAKNLSRSVEHLYVANRTPERAASVAEEVHAETTVVDMDDLADAVGAAHVVITATGSDDYVFDRETFESAGETYVVDIAQPRDVGPNAGEHSRVTVRDIEALESVTDENRAKRAEAAAAVEEMIDVEFQHLQAQYKRKRADRVISAMYESAERVKARELETAFEKVDELDEDQRAVVESMADSLVNQLLAAPTRSLRDAAEEDDWSTINTALQLFDPEFGPDAVSPPAVATTERVGTVDPDPEKLGDVDPDQLPEHMREQMPATVLDELYDE